MNSTLFWYFENKLFVWNHAISFWILAKRRFTFSWKSPSEFNFDEFIVSRRLWVAEALILVELPTYVVFNRIANTFWNRRNSYFVGFLVYWQRNMRIHFPEMKQKLTAKPASCYIFPAIIYLELHHDYRIQAAKKYSYT